MEMIFATILGCILCFLCGAGVVYGREYILNSVREEEVEEEEELSERDLKMQEQWVSLLDYRGESRE